MPITMLQFKADQLRKSPLYNLSLANKELFHSNFIAWFGNKYPNLFIELMNKVLGDGNDWMKNLQSHEMRIEREYKHFDIAVFDKKKGGNLRLIIENKVKSVPTLEQLDGYEANAGKGVKCVLLSMNGQFQNKELRPKGTKWYFVDYETLANEMLKLATDDTIMECYHRLLIKDYCSYVSSLQELILELTPSCIEDYLFAPADKDRLMRDLNIHDVCGKRSVQFVCSKLKERLKTSLKVVDDYKDLRPDNRTVQVAYGYTNAMPLIEVRFRKDNVDNILIQIQGKQYRHCVEFFDSEIGDRIEFNGRTYGVSKKGEDYLKENYPYVLLGNEALDNFPKLRTDGKPMKFGQRKDYCKYCNGRPSPFGYGCFVYQWVPIPNDIRISELIDAVCVDMLSLLNCSMK